MCEVNLRKAVWEDVNLLFEWANEEEVRGNSFNSKKINYQEHKKWFKQCLEDSDIDNYIFYHDSKPIGQIRLNYYNEIAVISYSIDKKYRGQGFGSLIIELIEDKIVQSNPTILCLIGRVKPNNIASQRIFENSGYVKRPVDISEEGFSYYKKIDHGVFSC